MVQYDAEIYNQEENNITGVRVVIASDVGDVIETIQVTNKTEFDEIISQLDTIDDTYIRVADGSSLSGETIDTILANEGSLTNINASKLGGHSDTYYSPVTHSHTAEDISNLYQYEISLSNYNPKIGEPVTITVKVTRYNDTPVRNALVTIYKDNISWVSGVPTNANGIYTRTFTPTTAGVVNFSIKNAKAQCNVQDEWKQVPLLKTLQQGFDATLWILESQQLANFRMYLRRYVGWTKDKSTTGMSEDNKDPISLQYIGENTNYVNKNGSRTWKFYGLDTHGLIPLDYAPSLTLSQPLFKGDWILHVHDTGDVSGTAAAFTSETNGPNWSVDVAFNQIWRYGYERP